MMEDSRVQTTDLSGGTGIINDMDKNVMWY